MFPALKRIIEKPRKPGIDEREEETGLELTPYGNGRGWLVDDGPYELQWESFLCPDRACTAPEIYETVERVRGYYNERAYGWRRDEEYGRDVYFSVREALRVHVREWLGRKDIE